MPYPVSDHCDGARFFNPEGARRRTGRFPMLRWVTRREGRAKWPERVENRIFAPPPSEVPEGHAAVTFIGHASFLIRLPGLVLLTDPILSERCSPVGWAGPRRVRPPGLTLDAMPKPDAILLSHNHYDHCDIPTLAALHARFGRIRIFAPLGNRAFLTRKGLGPATELDWWDHAELRGTRITLTPARHFAARTLRDRNATLWAASCCATPPASSISPATPAIPAISARSASVSAAPASRCCRSAPTRRAGSWAMST
ncbi:unnamed protein product [Acidocella sp. C78]|uniref:MBL fold metallo-hydrolase n=1 Tax=Acidocella sp. C78 TaxID=1671486 RepID=UPI001BC69CA2|nr:MBL fold metallo-hydrolase [Acidocella sp. C78]CAG4927797.1 unnamed protein product [Acidocella sp. C78]